MPEAVTLDFDQLARAVDAHGDLLQALRLASSLGPVVLLRTSWDVDLDGGRTLFVCSSPAQKPLLRGIGFGPGTIFTGRELYDMLGVIGDVPEDWEHAVLLVTQSPYETPY